MDDPGAHLGRVLEVLGRRGIVDVAVTGALALGVWARPRQTMDIDLCGVVPVEAVEPLLALHDGMRVGPEVVPDIIRFRVGAWDVDLFVSKTDFDRDCLARAVEVEIAGHRIRVVTPEDLLVHKFTKLRSDRSTLLQDLADMRAIVAAREGELQLDYVRRWLRPEEAEIFTALESLDDEALARKVLLRR